jgi:hypothetical protein
LELNTISQTFTARLNKAEPSEEELQWILVNTSCTNGKDNPQEVRGFNDICSRDYAVLYMGPPIFDIST